MYFFMIFFPIMTIFMLYAHFITLSNNINIIEKRYFMKDRYHYLNSNDLTLDIENYEGAEYIDCTYTYKNKRYKIIVTDYFDLNDLHDYTINKIQKATLMNGILNHDVTSHIRMYAGPQENFYDMKVDYRYMFPYIKSFKNWSIEIVYDDDCIQTIHLDSSINELQFDSDENISNIKDLTTKEENDIVLVN